MVKIKMSLTTKINLNCIGLKKFNFRENQVNINIFGSN